MTTWKVSIHASAREATDELRGERDTLEVSIHASAREATRTPEPAGLRPGVSIHASAREATVNRRVSILRAALFQSTPPHGRRHLVVVAVAGLANVSIHASAREATNQLAAKRGKVKFQSTPPHGRRRRTLRQTAQGRPVSIHASAREATGAGAATTSLLTLFQSTPPHGRRLPHARSLRQTGRFNPRLRTGGDGPPPQDGTARISCFNPRLRTGGDYPGKARRLQAMGFNPRLRTGGDTRMRQMRDSEQKVSIHASAREATVTGVGLRG